MSSMASLNRNSRSTLKKLGCPPKGLLHAEALEN